MPRTLCASRRNALFSASCLLALAATLAACDGENRFKQGITGPEQPDSVPAPAEEVQDTVAPSESRILLPLREEVVAVGDPVSVQVAVGDEAALQSVLVEGFAVSGGSLEPRYQPASVVFEEDAAVTRDTVGLSLQPMGDEPAETVLLVATAFDRAGNSTADTIEVSLAKLEGTIIPLENKVDRLVDLASDGRRVFLSNNSRHRIEVLDIATDVQSSFRVGSEPWGLAISPDSTTLYVANSGGTNLSVVDLTQSTLAEDEARRIYTPNLRLFQVPFGEVEVPAKDANGKVIFNEDGDTVRVTALSPTGVTIKEYSDRPQFVAQTASGLIVYSTRPTGSAPTGTIRTARPLPDGRTKVDIFTQYNSNEVDGQVVVVNADSVRHTRGDKSKLIVWPRPSPSPGFAITGYIDEVAAKLREGGYDTRIEYYLDVDQLGLSDTTFVGVSGDHQTIAFGEGARETGRVVLLRQDGNELLGQTADLVANASERVIGLALNHDGSLGAARGQDAYFFTPDLRLQGIARTGVSSGGVSMHPLHLGYPGTPNASRLAFVSGIDDNGSPYVDVLDTFSFSRRKRIFLREAITGALIVVPAAGRGDVVLHLYGITDGGVLRLDLDGAHLQP